MDTSQDRDQWTHEEVVTGARRALLEELALDETELGRAFLESPIGPRVRVGGVRSSLARFAAERVAAETHAGLRYGNFIEASDEVVIHLPATIEVRADLGLPVLSSVPLKLAPFLRDLADRGAGAIATDLRARKTPGPREVERRLRAAPPTYEGWTQLQPVDVARAFHPEPPLLSDQKELHRRIRLACTYAAERALLDRLAERNPGFVDYLQCFPVARALQRKVVAWLGPTNSGKTHRAILALSQAKSGMYLGPLRLLALEQRDRLTELGTPCSLITGEERDEQSLTHSARTVEMTDFSRRFEVCVLDEMQLAFDRNRGWAWVAAYCGVPAETLIVTGPVSAEPVVRRLAELCGDVIEVNYLERQGTLEYEGVIDWRRVPARSAVIGFSRAMVLELKAMFESRGLRVSVIYGGLSPEVRRNEARRFREGESDIVCATDAIGLGLNLPLDRVVFYETDKFDGEIDRPLSDAELLRSRDAPAAVRAPPAGSPRSRPATGDGSKGPSPNLSAPRHPTNCPPRRPRCTCARSPITSASIGSSPSWNFFAPGLPSPAARFFPTCRMTSSPQRNSSISTRRRLRSSNATRSPARPSISKNICSAAPSPTGWNNSTPANACSFPRASTPAAGSNRSRRRSSSSACIAGSH